MADSGSTARRLRLTLASLLAPLAPVLVIEAVFAYLGWAFVIPYVALVGAYLLMLLAVPVFRFSSARIVRRPERVVVIGATLGAAWGVLPSLVSAVVATKYTFADNFVWMLGETGVGAASGMIGGLAFYLLAGPTALRQTAARIAASDEASQGRLIEEGATLSPLRFLSGVAVIIATLAVTYFSYTRTRRSVDDLQLVRLESVPAGRFGGDPQLRFVLSSKVDLMALAKEREYTLHVVATHCTATGEPGQVIAEGHLDTGRHFVFADSAAASAERSGDSFVYHMSLPVRGAERDFGNTIQPAYDLASDRQDVCLFVGGGNFRGLSFDSNTVVVAPARFAAALAGQTDAGR